MIKRKPFKLYWCFLLLLPLVLPPMVYSRPPPPPPPPNPYDIIGPGNPIFDAAARGAEEGKAAKRLRLEKAAAAKAAEEEKLRQKKEKEAEEARKFLNEIEKENSVKKIEKESSVEKSLKGYGPKLSATTTEVQPPKAADTNASAENAAEQPSKKEGPKTPAGRRR